MKTLTPVVCVDRIEPCLGFWEQLGFEKKMEVPGDDGLAFAMLSSGAVEVMYQTRASIADDVEALADHPFGPSAFFVRVEDLNAVQTNLDDADKIVIERATFYGSRETIVRAPCGSIVTFAQFGDDG